MSDAVENEASAPEYEARAQKLVEALRSGEFEQVRHKLHNFDLGGYCCLGVACEVYRRETGNGRWARHHLGGGTFTLPTAVESYEMSKPVMEWYGFSSQAGGYACSQKLAKESAATGNWAHTLMRLNDTDRRSFSYIADVIDRRPPGLFTWTENEESEARGNDPDPGVSEKS